MGRRKTCDLCTIKKIRCDGGVPACSYCTTYAVPCKWTPGIHKLARPNRNKRRIPETSSQLAPVDVEVCTFADGVPLPVSDSAARNNELIHRSPAVSTNQASPKPNAVAKDDECLRMEIQAGERYPLPPLEDVEQLFDFFFANFNKFFPIFDYARAMGMLHDWYLTCPNSRDESTWAVINIIIALGLQYKPLTHPAFTTLEDSTFYAANAQSILDKLVMRVSDCHGIQVLLGLVVYFQKSMDRGPAQVLVASTIKLAFRLRLHMTQHGLDLAPKDILERKRLFWAAYILDRDVSMRVRDPYILQDHDFDVDPLEQVIRDEFTCDVDLPIDAGEFNYFRCRADLAFIQGKTHDWINSVKAERLVDYQKWEKRELLWTMLNEWMMTIPQPYHPNNLEHLDSPAEQAFISLYITRFRTICGIEKVFSHHTEWISGLIDYSVKWSADGQTADKPAQSPLPNHWKDLVESARTIMLLFRRVPKFYNGLLGNLCCAYCSALLIVVANKLVLPEVHVAGQPELDEALIMEGIEYMEAKYEVIAAPSLKAVSRACRELNRRADAAVGATKNKTQDTQDSIMPFGSALAPKTFQTLIFEPCGSLPETELQSAFIFKMWDP
ncbi:unnamed protein product [Clonostachys byssicola]|uniref:Zn(2)-C6 fungal-type domain-containing protein n=1 Tax=Clonostachys byssicola TaxID=160290 RepID=A0A9N9U3P8_9HYPO|nr:unnamed protein product [Clonostachys byssicola]